MAFFTGAPHQTVAVTTTDIRVWTLSRREFNKCLKGSPKLRNALRLFLHGKDIIQYLQERHGMDYDGAKGWVSSALESLQKEGVLLEAVPLVRRDDEFKLVVNKIRRVPFFSGLELEDIEEIATRVFTKNHEKGYTFFHQNEYADRMYIIECGEVALIDPGDKTRALLTLHPNDAFGTMAFLTGACHTVTAIATDNTTGAFPIFCKI